MSRSILRLCAWSLCLSMSSFVHAGDCGGQDDGYECDDNNVCTYDDQCSGNVCVGTPVNVSDFNDCTLDSCDPQSGSIITPLPDDTPCNDAPNGPGGVCVDAHYVATACMVGDGLCPGGCDASNDVEEETEKEMETERGLFLASSSQLLRPDALTNHHPFSNPYKHPNLHNPHTTPQRWSCAPPAASIFSSQRRRG